MITSIGLGVFGADFARLEAPERLAAVKRLLGQYRGLLVWDNFESVAEMPDPAGATPPLDEAGCAQLREFLHWVRDQSRSAVLITSRAREDWLGQVRRIAVGGLNRAEAAQYAGQLLAPYPAAQRRRERPSFGELLDWLDGHPLSMRLTLPRLETLDPAGLLAGLRGTAPLPTAEDAGGGPDHIAGRVHHLLLRPPDRPGQAAAPGDQPVPRHCRRGRPDALLRRRGGAGPVRGDQQGGVDGGAGGRGPGRAADRPIGDGMYRIHPALPGYLAAGWQADDPGSYDQERQACEQALCAACAAFSQWLTGQIESGNAALAYAVIGLQRRTLGAMLADALDRHAWDDAESIVRALDAYWDTRGLGEEAAAWADRILAATAGPGQPPPGPMPARCGCTPPFTRPPGRRTPGSRTRPGKPTGGPSPTCKTSPKPNGPAETSPLYTTSSA